MPLIPLPATPIRLIFLGGSRRIARALFSVSVFMRSSRSKSSSSSSSSSKLRLVPASGTTERTDSAQNRTSSSVPTLSPLEDEDNYEGRFHLAPLLEPSNSLQISVAASLVANLSMFFESWSRRSRFANSSSIRLATDSPFADAESITSAAAAC
jgi:hypothetical protein